MCQSAKAPPTWGDTCRPGIVRFHLKLFYCAVSGVHNEVHEVGYLRAKGVNFGSSGGQPEVKGWHLMVVFFLRFTCEVCKMRHREEALLAPPLPCPSSFSFFIYLFF